MDEMKPKERVSAYLEGKEVDRIPINLMAGETTTSLYGISIYDYHHNSEIMANIEIENFKKFKTDFVGVSLNKLIVEILGSKINFDGKSVPYVEEYAIKNVEDMDKLDLINPRKDGRIPIVLEAMDKLIERIGREVEIGIGLVGPMSIAANLCGAENLLRWTVKSPDKLKKMLEFIVECNNLVIEEVSKRDVGISFSDPVSSMNLLRKKQFDIFSYPYLKENINNVKRKTGKDAGIHICGLSKEIWEDLINLEISSFSIDNIESIKEAKKIMGNKVTIVGNVPPYDVISIGTKESIYDSVKNCIKEGYDSPKGFILAPGCQIPMNTSEENIHCFVEAGKKYGKFPINI